MYMSNNKIRRFTKQRRLVHDAIINRTDHPTAKEVFDELKETGIGIATVYRHLSSMVAEGLLRTVYHGKEIRYDPLILPHAHAVCSFCNEIIDLKLPNDLNRLAPNIPGFVIRDVELTWKGICDNCL